MLEPKQCVHATAQTLAFEGTSKHHKSDYQGTPKVQKIYTPK